MQIDAIALTLRLRSMWEGCASGVRLLALQNAIGLRAIVVAVPPFAVLREPDEQSREPRLERIGREAQQKGGHGDDEIAA